MLWNAVFIKAREHKNFLLKVLHVFWPACISIFLSKPFTYYNLLLLTDDILFLEKYSDSHEKVFCLN